MRVGAPGVVASSGFMQMPARSIPGAVAAISASFLASPLYRAMAEPPTNGVGVPEPEQWMLFALALAVLACGVAMSLSLAAVAGVLCSVRKRRVLGVVVGVGSFLPAGCAIIVTSPVLLLLLGWVLYWLFGDAAWWAK